MRDKKMKGARLTDLARARLDISTCVWNEDYHFFESSASH